MERTAYTGISNFGPASLFQGIFATVATWQDRARGRNHLAGLESHMLKDIGIDAADVRREVAKPFWRT